MKSDSQQYYNNITFNPVLLTILIIILILYFIMFGSLGHSESNIQIDSVLGFNILKIVGIIIFIMLIIAIVLYFTNPNIKNYLRKKHAINIVLNNGSNDGSNIIKDSSNNVPIVHDVEQVYHIPGNIYTYDNAKAVCSAYGNKIANYVQMEDAYNKGADWCSYGWSDNQMAFFPTQNSSWNELQKIKGHENDCGRPGINGGYIDNPNIKYGVNCYGHKPKITPQSATLMKTETLYPTTQKELDFNKSVSYWQNKIDNILVAPFNHKVWSI